MPVALLDVNVLVALFDPEHVHHQPAHEWFTEHRHAGWASCPLTENGVVRVLSNPSYGGRSTDLEDAVERLAAFRASGDHVFWPDDISLCDEDRFRFRHVAGHRQLTDAYLLALAVHYRGRFATFDRRIRIDAATGAMAEHLVLVTDPVSPSV